jgi:catechol 2,3-dioxygenase-like lactoylglutathione lyase family enzyme
MTVYTGINHLAMVTDDMEATIHFWRDLLGTRLVAGLGNGQYRQSIPLIPTIFPSSSVHR